MRAKTLLSSIATTAALTLSLAPAGLSAHDMLLVGLECRRSGCRNQQSVPRWLPIESRDGLSLYIASSRTGTLGGNDIWAADRVEQGRALRRTDESRRPGQLAGQRLLPDARFRAAI